MKKLLNLITFLLLTCAGFAQEKRPLKDPDGNLNNYKVSSLSSKIPVFLKPDEQTRSISPFNYIPNDPLGNAVILEGAKTATVTALIHEDSLTYYRYAILEDDSIAIVSNRPLTKIDFVWNERSAHPGYFTMNLGIGNISNKKITLKIYSLLNEAMVTTVIIYNKPLKPAQLSGISLVTLNQDKKVTYNGLVYNKFKSSLIKNGAEVTESDQNTGLAIAKKKTDLDFIYHLYVVHSDETGQRIMLQTNNWAYNNDYEGTPGYYIDYNYFKQPGNYEVVIAPGKLSAAQLKDSKLAAGRFSFKVLPAPKTYSGREVAMFVFAVITVSILIIIASILFIRRKNQARLQVAALQTEVAKSELNMVRSNLNPHFVFNALSGIQTLINKNDVERANNYLSKFAGLSRHMLNDNALISIREEMNLLNDYLAMEQLRFPFQYSIDADDDVNDNIEIPVMLIQPFVENAVKHGVMPIGSKGDIKIYFSRHGKDLKIIVTDNGKGFDVNSNYDGLGLKLSRKRIDLLNKTYTECPIKLNISSTGNQTSVVILLTQWL
ncbi:sensor histidine kinase [Mucilaginibacter auburnensis]|uniref:Histidine kinase n=1 Tax=Mucilaginibacter auburnensis TaxID=1457233 RepID=A0A2H9VPH5_9SPHI|nr:histidine kinase [Mucilaginibacter auburnensis]PJJ80248.1 histidine kinase [Mucilaginibacter auburnensis]